MAPEPHLTLRRAVETDSAVIAALHIAAWQWAYRGQLPDALLDGLTVQIDRRTARRREQLVRLSSPERTWVAEAAGQIVGFADTGLSRDADAAPDTAELYAIYLARDAVGKGIGRTLLAHALGDLRGRGYRAATLWVLTTNARARRFYEAAGWRPDGTTKTVQLAADVDLNELRYHIDLKR